MYIAHGIKIESHFHPCQDALGQGHFTSNDGNEVFYGVVSDGCSSAWGSQHGAEFLVTEFGKIVKESYNLGLRRVELLNDIVIRLSRAMLSYKPRDDKSELFLYDDKTLSSELYATLLGYIADDDRILMLLAGDGFIGVNGAIEQIDSNNNAVYPIYLLAVPEDEWTEQNRFVYNKVDMPRDRVNNILLATDGFEVEPYHSELLGTPELLIDKIMEEASRKSFPKHRKDDTALLVLSLVEQQSRDPLPLDAAERIVFESELRNPDLVFDRYVRHDAEIVRLEDRTEWHSFVAGNDSKAGIALYLPKAKAESAVERPASTCKTWFEKFCMSPTEKVWAWMSRKPYDNRDEQDGNL